MDIQPLKRTDAATYRSLMLEAYTLHPEAFTSSVEEREAAPLSWWQSRLDTTSTQSEQVFGAWLGDRLVGAAGLTFEPRMKSRHKGTLFGMFVREEARRLGAGRALVEAVLEAARACDGARLVGLTVTEGNDAALRLYQACGFRAWGSEPMAVRVAGQFHAKVHMWRALP